MEIISRSHGLTPHCCRFDFQDEVPKLYESLHKALKSGVQTRIISAHSSITDGEKIDISEVFKGLGL